VSDPYSLLVKGGPSHERPSEAWEPRSPHNDSLGLAVPTAQLFLNLLQLSLTLNFTSIQQRRSNRRLQSFEKQKFRLASMTCGHRLPLLGAGSEKYGPGSGCQGAGSQADLRSGGIRLNLTPVCGLLQQMSHVAWSVCLCVGHTDVPCKVGWTDRDVVWGADSWAQGTMY